MLNLLFSGLLLTTASGQAAGFPVDLPGKNRAAAINIADLDADGNVDIIALAGNALVVLYGGGERAGQIKSGFPVSYVRGGRNSEFAIAHAPLVCDVDADGALDIVLASTSRELWAWRSTGTLLPGYPLALKDQVAGPIVCAGKGQVLLLTKGGKLIRVQNHALQTLATVGRGGNTSGIAVADMNADGRKDYILIGGDAQLRIYNANGTLQPIAVYRSQFRASGIPAIGDIDDDGHPDIVFGSEDFQIHAVDHKGRALSGFPVKTGYRVYASAALGDLNSDGVSDVVIASGDGKVYALDGHGKSLRGFPVKLGERLWADPVIGDVDRDGHLNIVVPTGKGVLHVLNWRGKSLKGYPKKMKGQGRVAAALVDLDHNGSADIVAQGTHGTLYAFQTVSKDKVKSALTPWPMSGHDSSFTGRFGPNAPRFKKLTLTDPKPKTTDNLKIHYAYFDLDGDKEVGTRIQWYRNGTLVPELSQSREVAARLTKKHEEWHYTVQSGEGFERFGSTGPLARIAVSPTFGIRNTPPGAPEITLKPLEARTDTPLKVSVHKPSVDADGDPVRYGYLWLRDGEPVPKLPPTTTEVPVSMTHKGEQWRVIVVPNDGEADGVPISALVEIKNSVPTTPSIAFAPTKNNHSSAPNRPQGAYIKVIKPSLDADRDTIHYRYRYWLDDAPLSLRRDSGKIPGNVLTKGRTLKVEVAALDAESMSAPVLLSIAVVNTPPPLPKIAIHPRNPHTDEALSFRIVSQSPDADADAIRYRHRWLLNGKLTKHQGTVPSADTKKGQVWRVEVTTLDGESETAATSIETKIINRAPRQPRFGLTDHHPTTEDTVSPKLLRASSDVDALDEKQIRYVYRWFKNGTLQKFPDTMATLDGKYTHKREQWRVHITATDGENESTVEALNFNIRNTPPPPPVLSVKSTQIRVRDRMTVAIAAPVVDVDADKISYTYAWFRNGKPLSFPSNKNTLLPGEAQKGDRLRVEVRSKDGDADDGISPPTVANLWLINSVPDAPKPSLIPARPTAANDLTCKPGRLTDADAADVSHLRAEITWLRNAKPMEFASNAAVLPRSLLQRGESWACEVRVQDGESSSVPTRTAALVIGNAPPSAPRVRMGPKKPKTTDDLICELSRAATDVDSDAIEYTYRWERNGRPYTPKNAAEPHVVRAANTRSGQQWACTAVASDSKASSPLTRAAAVIHNTVPTAARVVILPEQPEPHKSISCSITRRARDADKEKLRYSYTWYKNGVLQTFAPSSTKVPGRLVRKNQKWRCTVVASDGKSDGPVATSPMVEVGGR